MSLCRVWKNSHLRSRVRSGVRRRLSAVRQTVRRAVSAQQLQGRQVVRQSGRRHRRLSNVRRAVPAMPREMRVAVRALAVLRTVLLRVRPAALRSTVRQKI